MPFESMNLAWSKPVGEGRWQVEEYVPDKPGLARCMAVMSKPDSLVFSYSRLAPMTFPEVGDVIVMLADGGPKEYGILSLELCKQLAWKLILGHF